MSDVITLQSGLREYDQNLQPYTGMLGGLTPDVHTLRALNPLTTNRVLVVMYRVPWFLLQYFGGANGNAYANTSPLMTKKIDKKKYIIGVSVIKRIAGTPSGKTGPDSWFETSPDKAVEDKRFFAEGFEKELAEFDHYMIGHFKNSVGSSQIREAEYADKIITRAPGKKVLGFYLSSTAIFIAMIIVWGLIFKNFALGICFALCFTSCFAVVTNKTKSEEKDLSQAGN